MKRRLPSLTALVVALFVATPAAAQKTENVLVKTKKPYGALTSYIQALGGRVTQQYKNVDAIAAVIPNAQLAALRAVAGENAVIKDLDVPNPAPVDVTPDRAGLVSSGEEENTTADSVEPMGAAEISRLASNPNAYLVNNAALNVTPLLAAGITGQGVIVGVIDSGIRPGFPHISLDGSVVGCEDFVGDSNGCSHFGNNGHGTFVAGMISANVAFGFSPASGLRNAVLAECPACFDDPPTNTVIPMIGSAPLSSIYAFRVFGPTGGAPTSRVLAAFDRAVSLKRDFNNGVAGGVNIQVINMSLGGSTLFAGRDLFDSAMQTALDANIVLSISAGNTGPATLTVGSPGTSYPTITVGASSDAVHERILRRAQLGPALGALYRPFLGTQMSYFSSRGPNADGNIDPDVVANGFACYGQGTGSTTGTISIGSGTSFSAPTVSGVAALLRQAFPNATARRIRNAIIQSANPNVLSDGSTVFDQGKGFVNAQAAYDLLQAGHVSDKLPRPPLSTPFVGLNVELNTNLQVHRGLFVNKHFQDLKPGQRADVLYRVWPLTERVVVTLDGVTPALPPDQQNQLFGDDILLAVHSAKTSAIGGVGDYPGFDFTTGTQVIIEDPEPGILRISVNGDWTNAGMISADVHVSADLDPQGKISKSGKIKGGEQRIFAFEMPAGVATAEIELGWQAGWENYPANDLDMVLAAPGGALNFDGASQNSPERVTLTNPPAGTWTIVVDGFEVNTKVDLFTIRAILDGTTIKIN